MRCSQIPVCVLNVSSLFSNTAVLGESTRIENRLSLIDQSNPCKCTGRGKKEKGCGGVGGWVEMGGHIKVSPSTNNKYQTARGGVKRRGDFGAHAPGEIQVDETREWKERMLEVRVGRKAGRVERMVPSIPLLIG